MNKKGEQNKLMIIMLLVMIILIGFAFITSVANTKGGQTNKQTILNKSISVASAYINETYVNSSFNYTIYSQSDWKVSECPLTDVKISIGNGTLLVDGVGYTLYSPQGVYSMKNSSLTIPVNSKNVTLVNATYCPDGYLTSSTDRGLIDLIPTLMIILILVIAAGTAYKMLNEN